MSKLLLDTSAYSAFKRNHSVTVAAIQSAPQILLSVTVLGELYAGFAAGSQTERNHEELNALLQNGRVQIVPIKKGTAERYANIYLYLRKLGRPIPTNDLWIAASAMEHSATLITADAHFNHIPQIIVQSIT